MGNRAKLLLFSHVCNTRSITGAEKLLLLLCQKLSTYFDCVLAAPQEGQLTKRARQIGIRTRIHAYPLLHEMYTPSANLYTDAERLRSGPGLKKLAEMIRAEQPDLVLVNTCVNVLPAMAASSLGIPVVWNITESITINEYTPLAVGLIDKYSTWITGISESAVTVFQGTAAAPKVGILFPSWDPASVHPQQWEQIREGKRSELGLRPDHRVIGYISSFLTKEKGLEHFIDMALSICNSDKSVHFLVIGRIIDQDFYARCLSKVNVSAYKDRFTFVVFEESVEAAYSAMDIVVVPSLVPEGFGLTALEAMIYGKPVVAYASGGLQEILETAGCGYLLAEPGNVHELAGRVQLLLGDSVLAAGTAAMNLQRVNEAYGPQTYEERLRQLLVQWSLQHPELIRLEEDTRGLRCIPVKPAAAEAAGPNRAGDGHSKHSAKSIRRHRKRKRSRPGHNRRHEGKSRILRAKRRRAALRETPRRKSKAGRSAKAADHKRSRSRRRSLSGAHKHRKRSRKTA
ncbi:glycosyltransferase family 4 protein [Paenibacillus sp. YPG26]|uniref:glycosyltransferase family 4 protein n=1 Tax=Paenibacillus sp. YPG26 TaxID=2878915 RepID=UPI00203F26E8|nr:glycosyltransferase family 4 protein [Paenibacillus sp. YPG26]USB32480.1 glycosyltransferase family 4 protein [Paenibacillus sp. YPG26]